MWNLLDPRPSQSALVVASESEHLSLARHDYRVQRSTRNFKDLDLKNGILDDLVLALGLLILRLDLELLNRGETDGSFGLALVRGMVVLIGLTRAIDVELECGWSK